MLRTHRYTYTNTLLGGSSLFAACLASDSLSPMTFLLAIFVSLLLPPFTRSGAPSVGQAGQGERRQLEHVRAAVGGLHRAVQLLRHTVLDVSGSAAVRWRVRGHAGAEHVLSGGRGRGMWISLLFLLSYVTYPGAVFTILPCDKVKDVYYLKADYSVECKTAEYYR